MYVSLKIMAHITFIVHDLASNAIGRAAPLVDAIAADGHDVEVLGLLLSGDGVYAPYKHRYDYKTIVAKDGMGRHLLPLARLAKGEIVYCCKPKWTTLVPALIATGMGVLKPLLIDIEDDELWVDESRLGNSWLRPLRRLWEKRYNLLLHPFVKCAVGITVVSTRLQRRYGGELVWHGPNERLFDPSRPELTVERCRNHFGIPRDRPCVLFVGNPHPHKGVELLITALQDPRLADVVLVLAGPAQHPVFQLALQRLSRRVYLLGYVDNALMPELLTAADIVATPQLRNAFAESQVPSKLLEAMAMRKCVVASDVSDLRAILEPTPNVRRGWIHTPGNAMHIADTLVRVLEDPNEARRRGAAARDWFIGHASQAAIIRRMRPVIERALARL